MGELIPLFPLGTPLFPGVVLPLQIFEPRYRRLMRDLLAVPDAEDRRFFGVVAIRQGWEVEHVAPAEALYDIGCTARVQAVRAEPDGGFRIVTVGGERFRLLDVVIGDEPPYLRAEVEWLVDEEQAEEAAGDHDGIVEPRGLVVPGEGAAAAMDDVVASVARGSMDVLSRNVRDLFTRYVAEVAGLGDVERYDDPDDDEPAVDAETSVLLHAVAGARAQLTVIGVANCTSGTGTAPSVRSRVSSRRNRRDSAASRRRVADSARSACRSSVVSSAADATR